MRNTRFIVVAFLIGCGMSVTAPRIVAAQGPAQDAFSSEKQQIKQLEDEGRAAIAKNDFRTAIGLYERILVIEEKVYGLDHLELTGTLYNLGYMHSELGDHRKALPLLERSLAILDKHRGPDGAGIAKVASVLATVLRRMDENARALPLQRRALALLEKSHAADSVEVGIALNRLALIHQALREYATALPLYLRSLGIIEKARGADHPEVAIILANIVLAYRSLGDSAKALPYAERGLAVRRKHLGPGHPDVADSLNTLVVVLRELGEYRKALPFAQENVALREKTLGPDHYNVAQSLNELARLYSEVGEYAKALPLRQRVLAILEKLHGPDHTDIAASLGNLALLYHSMGESAKAIPLLERSLSIEEKARGPDDPGIVVNLSNLGGMYRQTGQYAKALPLLERGVAIREKAFGPSHPAVATSLSNLAGLYDSIGDYPKALALSERSLAIREKALGPDHPDVAISLNNLAHMYARAGERAKALPLYQRTLSIYEKLVGPEHPTVATVLSNLGVSHDHLGEYAQALPLHQRSLAIRERALGPDHPDVAHSLNNLAVSYGELGDYARTLQLFKRSLAIMEKAWGPEHPRVAAALDNLSTVYMKMGDYGQAIPLLRGSFMMRLKILGPDHPDLATSIVSLARAIVAAGEPAKALPLMQRSLAIRERALGPTHPETAESLVWLAMLHHATRDYSEALPLYHRALQIATDRGLPLLLSEVQGNLAASHAMEKQRSAAIFFGKQAVNTLQGMRAGLTGVDRELQKSFLTSKESYYQNLAGWLVEEGRLPEAQQVLAMLKEEELFDFLRSGGAEDARKTQASYTGEEARWAKRFEEIRTKLAGIGAELEALEKKAKLGLTDAERARRGALERDREVGQQAFERFLGELMKELGGIAAAERQRDIGSRNLADLQALQETLSALGHGAVTLHYLVLEEKTHIILTTPQVQLARESAIKAADLNQRIQRYRQVLQDPRRNPLPLAQELYRILIAPVAEDLGQAKAQTLMVSLDGALRYLPVAALHDGKRYLAETYALAIYTEAAKDRLKDKPTPAWQFAGLGVTRQVEGFSPLPTVREELEGIVKAGVLPGEAFFDEQFTADQFRATLDKRPSVLHIASHFVFQPGTESNSFLLLGDGSRLSLADLKRYRFRDVDLITLSACETAVGGGRNENGREIEGFGALAQRQGAKGVLATLWPVADQSTGAFMQALYRIRQATPGTTKAEALRQAQISFIRGGQTTSADSSARGLAQAGAGSVPDAGAPYAHPFFWAPFILMGNWL